MRERRKGGEAKAETGVGKGGIGGIRMARRGRIEGIDRGIDHNVDRQIGRETGTRIEESGREATRGEEMMIGQPVDGTSGVTRQSHIRGGGTHEIEIMVTEDDEYQL